MSLINNQGEIVDQYRNFYVYIHHEPDDDIALYIGTGTAERAWAWRKSNRSAEHYEWIKGLLEDGYLPCDWVTILHRGLSKEEALEIEAQYVKEHDPLYNQLHSFSYLKERCKKKFGEDKISKIKELRKAGFSYKRISEIMPDVGTTMTIHRIMRYFDE